MTFHALHRLSPHLLLAFLLIGACCLSCQRGRKEDNDSRISTPIPAAPEPSSSPLSEAREQPTGPVRLVSGAELLESIALSGAKATLVNAWASWCGPCRREFPMLVALRDSLSAQNVDVIFVSVDEMNTTDVAVEFAEQRGVVRPILVAQRPLGPFKEAMSPNWPGMLPATFLFDEDGKLRYFWGGPVYEEELLPIVEGFLSGKNIDGMARVGLRRGKDFRQE